MTRARTALLAALLASGASLACGEDGATAPGAGEERILFAAYAGGAAEMDVWSMAPDGSALRALITGPGFQHNAVASPDGRRIAYTETLASGESRLLVADGDGRNGRALATEQDAGYAYLSWTPDGRRLVYLRLVSEATWRTWEIQSIGVDGGDPRQLTTNDAAEYAPQLSPDGSRIAFFRDDDGIGGTARWTLWIMNADGTGAAPLPAAGQIVFAPMLAWSPDGARLAYSADLEPTSISHAGLYVIDATGANRRQLTDEQHGDRYPSWSPDGLSIAFSSMNRVRGSDFTTHNRLFVVPAAGGAARMLPSASVLDIQPSWGR